MCVDWGVFARNTTAVMIISIYPPVQRRPEHAHNAHGRVQAANEARAAHDQAQRRAERAANKRPFIRIVMATIRVKDAAGWIDHQMQLQCGPNDPKIENPSALVRLQRGDVVEIRERCRNNCLSSSHEIRALQRPCVRPGAAISAEQA